MFWGVVYGMNLLVYAIERRTLHDGLSGHEKETLSWEGDLNLQRTGRGVGTSDAW